MVQRVAPWQRADGGSGAGDRANPVPDPPANWPGEHTFVYDDDATLWEKIEAVATRVYGAEGITAEPKVKDQLAKWSELYPTYPVCMAKTQMSFSTDPALRGAPSGHTVHVRDVRLANGAGFIVAICGSIMTMPGLPKVPAAERIDIDEQGNISGLF